MGKTDKSDAIEFWLRGPVDGIPSFLQPAAHALLQSYKEIHDYLWDFPQDLLWNQLEGRASVGFHIQHMTGVLDRMMTYAKGEPLTDAQFEYLKSEGVPKEELTLTGLKSGFKDQVEVALAYFKGLSEDILMEPRSVGRKKLPSTVLGLLFHAAEHSQRHVGQLLVTASVLKSQRGKIN
ncbi:DinB family protein [Maribacter algicola]|uniref:DinB family protein n=1 Tax=Maribacter algicola TaxID=2498892 RepID=A0A426RET8_9FLAO|nr:DinB family protein [Maribacter algicola]RRQ47495.1 DinB family protein [Maribacter algicola]